MSKNKKRHRNVFETLDLNSSARSEDPVMSVDAGNDSGRPLIGLWASYLRANWIAVGALVLVFFLGLGVMAKNGWLPRTDLSGKRTGWFGSELPKNASSSWNPLAMPTATPTPQLSKEYIYAGSRLLAVEDANANVAPPADLAVWRPSSGVWWVMGPGGSVQASYGWGVAGDVPVAGDFDGDGKTDFSVYRPSTGTWWVTRSSDSTYYAVQFGASCTPPNGCDITAPADYDGDGKTDIAVWRPSTGVWYVIQSSNGVNIYPVYGTNGDKPSPADYDGDGKADIAVWRGSDTTFYSVNSTNGVSQTVAFNTPGTEPVSGDYDGDGKANYAVRNGADWFIMNAARTSATPAITWQSAGDISVQNDYDGDGKVDIAVWRDSNGHWYIRKSGSGGALREEAWGTSGDIAVPVFYRR